MDLPLPASCWEIKRSHREYTGSASLWREGEGGREREVEREREGGGRERWREKERGGEGGRERGGGREGERETYM